MIAVAVAIDDDSLDVIDCHWYDYCYFHCRCWMLAGGYSDVLHERLVALLLHPWWF